MSFVRVCSMKLNSEGPGTVSTRKSFGISAVFVSHSDERLQPCSAAEVGINVDRDARGKSCLSMLETYCYSLRRATIEMNPK